MNNNQEVCESCVICEVLKVFPRATCEQLPDTMYAIWPNDGGDVHGCVGVGNYPKEAWENAKFHVTPKPTPDPKVEQVASGVCGIDPVWLKAPEPTGDEKRQPMKCVRRLSVEDISRVYIAGQRNDIRPKAN